MEVDRMLQPGWGNIHKIIGFEACEVDDGHPGFLGCKLAVMVATATLANHCQSAEALPALTENEGHEGACFSLCSPMHVFMQLEDAAR